MTKTSAATHVAKSVHIPTGAKAEKAAEAHGPVKLTAFTIKGPRGVRKTIVAYKVGTGKDTTIVVAEGGRRGEGRPHRGEGRRSVRYLTWVARPRTLK
jgi:hypothetical protein